MAHFYDDNFGHWEGMTPDDPDYESNIAFYNQVQRDSIWKICSRCDKKVKLRKDYAICNSCCELEEKGFQY